MSILVQTVRFIESGQPFCVVLVLSAEGSTPRGAGVRAVVEADGRIHGTVGGGVLEAEAQRAAVEACRSGQPVMLAIDLTGDETAGLEPICGGTVRVLVDPTAPRNAQAYREAARAEEERRRGVLVTCVREGPPVSTEVKWHPGREPGTEARGEWVLVEPIAPAPQLLIAGGGHIGQALAGQAVLVGFEVTVIDDRPEFADPALFPTGARTVCADIAATLAGMDTDDETYIAIVTRGHRYDAEALQACLAKPATYVGMIGSKRKVALIREGLLASGAATEEQLDAVHAPIGLDIGAETVPEIATSILAEMIAVRRGRSSGTRSRFGTTESGHVPESPMICAIVLAAGRSRRMGRQKLLLPFGASTVIGHIVDQVLASKVHDAYVVVGSDEAAVAEALGDRPVHLIRNPEPQAEMLSSVRCGLRALPPGCCAVVVVLGDQPGVSCSLVNALIDAHFGSGKGLVVPVHEGRRGHPLLLAIGYREEVLTAHDAVGLRGMLQAHPEDVLEVEADSAATSDMDRPEDYLRERSRAPAQLAQSEK